MMNVQVEILGWQRATNKQTNKTYGDEVVGWAIYRWAVYRYSDRYAALTAGV